MHAISELVKQRAWRIPPYKAMRPGAYTTADRNFNGTAEWPEFPGCVPPQKACAYPTFRWKAAARQRKPVLYGAEISGPRSNRAKLARIQPAPSGNPFDGA